MLIKIIISNTHFIQPWLHGISFKILYQRGSFSGQKRLCSIYVTSLRRWRSELLRVRSIFLINAEVLQDKNKFPLLIFDSTPSIFIIGIFPQYVIITVVSSKLRKLCLTYYCSTKLNYIIPQVWLIIFYYVIYDKND